MNEAKRIWCACQQVGSHTRKSLFGKNIEVGGSRSLGASSQWMLSRKVVECELLDLRDAVEAPSTPDCCKGPAFRKDTE